MKSQTILSAALLALLVGCGGSTSEEPTVQDPQKIALRSDSANNSVEFPIGTPSAITVPSGIRVHLTTATPVSWTIRFPGAGVQRLGNSFQLGGVTVTEETGSAPAKTWTATITGATDSLNTLAFELVADTQPQSVIQFYMAR